MGISEFQEIEDLFSKNGVSQIYVKELSKKQDNDKNQIYLGKDIRGFPGRIKERSSSNSTSKRKSDFGKNKVELLLYFNFFIFTLKPIHIFCSYLLYLITSASSRSL